jgi:hypothetical protein
VTVQGPFITVQVDWRLLVISSVTLVLLPILTNLISSDVRELLSDCSRRLVEWAARLQPAWAQEIREEEWRGQLDETPGTIPKLVRAIGIAVHAPFTSRAARGLPLRRDQLGQLLWRLLCAGLVGVSELAGRGRHGRRATHAFLSNGWRRVQGFLTRPTEVADTGRLVAWSSILLLSIGLLYLGMGWRGVIAFDGSRPWPVLIGWGLMRLTISLNGHRALVLGSGVAVLTIALALALYTRNYHTAPLWVNAVAVGTSVLGAMAAIPLLVMLAVFVANLLLWILIGVGVFVILWIIVAANDSFDTRDRAPN